MPRPTSDQVSAAAAVAGVCATLVGAIFVYLQIGQANIALVANNSYMINRDINDAFDRILVAEDESKQSKNDQDAAKIASTLKREALKLDALFESAEALKNNGGLSQESWKAMLMNYCPFGSKTNYKFADVDLDGLKDACTRDPQLWRDNPR